MNTDWVGGVLLGVLVIVLIICGPLATIWAINTLFGLSIGYTLKTWLAAFVLFGVLNGLRGRWRSKD